MTSDVMLLSGLSSFRQSVAHVPLVRDQDEVPLSADDVSDHLAVMAFSYGMHKRPSPHTQADQQVQLEATSRLDF